MLDLPVWDKDHFLSNKDSFFVAFHGVPRKEDLHVRTDILGCDLIK